MSEMSQITDHTLPPEGRDGQHDPGEIPGLLEPILNDAADLVIGFRPYGQMPVYRRFGRAVLDYVTGVDGVVTDSQCGFMTLNKKATLSLAGTLKKDDFSIESEMMRASHDMRLRMAEVQIQCRYGDFDISAKNPVSHGVGVLRLFMGLMLNVVSRLGGGCGWRRCVIVGFKSPKDIVSSKD